MVSQCHRPLSTVEIYIGCQSDSVSSCTPHRTAVLFSSSNRPVGCRPSDVCDLLIVTFLPLLPVLNLLLPLELFVCLRLIIGILSLYISAHLTVLLLLNPVLNLTFSLLPITPSHSYASASHSTFD